MAGRENEFRNGFAALKIDGLIAAGGDDAQPSHHLISRSLVGLVQELKSRYDVVLIDTPPAGIFQDAVVLARIAQERVLVARESKAPLAQVQKVVADFDRAGAAFTGTVLNGFNPSTAHKKLAYAYHGKEYGYGATGKASKKK